MSKSKPQSASDQATASEAASEAVNEAIDAHSRDQAFRDVLDQAAGPAAGAGADSLQSRLAEAEREVLRVRAEMENFRKRMQRDSEQQLKYANLPLVRDLIEVVDNLNRASEAANQDSVNQAASGQASAPATAQTAALREGVRIVIAQLAGVMSKYDCKLIASVGHEFDPNVHEAIAQLPSQEYSAGTVMQEVAAGYLLHDRVVRPSSVIVSSGSPS